VQILTVDWLAPFLMTEILLISLVIGWLLNTSFTLFLISMMSPMSKLDDWIVDRLMSIPGDFPPTSREELPLCEALWDGVIGPDEPVVPVDLVTPIVGGG
jgi:hypothetical protein